MKSKNLEKLPSSIQIGPFTKKVTWLDAPFVKKASDGGKVVGLHRAMEHELVIAKQYHKDNPKHSLETFIHEVMESVLDAYGLETSHSDLSTLSVGIYQALASANIFKEYDWGN